MLSLFYLYAFIYITHKVVSMFTFKNEKPMEVNLLNVNLPELLGRVLKLDFIISICNCIWVFVGVFYHESLLFCIILFVDGVAIFGLFKNGPAKVNSLFVINTIVKISVASFILIKQFYL